MRLTYLSVYDNRDDASESASSLLSIYAHRYIGSRNPTRHTVPNSARLTYLNVCDSRDGTSSASSPLSIYAHSIQSHTLLTPTLLTFMYTQVLWCLALFVRSRASGVTMTPDIRLTILSTRVHSQVLSLFLTSFDIYSLCSRSQYLEVIAPPLEQVSELERLRQENIARNNDFLSSLGIYSAKPPAALTTGIYVSCAVT